MSRMRRRPIGFGEPVPALTVRSTLKPFPLARLAGMERSLVFVAALGVPGAEERLARCRSLLDRFGAGEALWFVSCDPADDPRPALLEPGIHGRVVLDGERQVADRFGIEPPAGDGAVAFRLDRALRVVERRAVTRIEDLEGLLAGWQARPAPGPAPRRLGPQPPVLQLDKVFEPAFSAALVHWHESTGGVESGFMVNDGARTVGRLDPRIKRRSDALVTDPTLVDQCRKRLVLRLGPAIETAFQFRATRIERYLVARYDSADGGMFRAHRDNDTGATAHRRFAVSVNLNDGYEGGCLRFPEFGDDLYRPDPGSALAFSCSLLHEATPVTSGTRYVFLTFLYGEEDAARRERDQGQAPVGQA